VKIIHVQAVEVRSLRNLVLRPNQPIESTYYELDEDKKTLHLACQEKSKIISIGTFYPQKHKNLSTKKSYRLRGMATDPNYRRRSAASKLMHASFEILKDKDCDVLWCNARLIAIKFYESLGFVKTGNQFHIGDIGAHYFMYKNINLP
tara:strand:+ start:3643 stop:4086 length:444 start_codon:yes stop_codon:yes gene_type:complete